MPNEQCFVEERLKDRERQDRQSGRKTKRGTEIQKNSEREINKTTKTERQRARKMERQERQTDRQRYRKIDRDTER